MHSKSFRAWAIHAWRSSGLDIKNLAFAFNVVNHRVSITTKFGHLLGRINDHVHRPKSRPEESLNPPGRLQWTESRVHFDHQIKVAIRTPIATRTAAEENHSTRMYNSQKLIPFTNKPANPGCKQPGRSMEKLMSPTASNSPPPGILRLAADNAAGFYQVRKFFRSPI